MDDATITVEGIVEDIDVATPRDTVATQCKYHETANKFVESMIFKPILQMMEHFHQQKNTKTKYRLFAHFPDKVGVPTLPIDKNYLKNALATDNRELAGYVTRLSGVDTDAFADLCTLEFGPAFDDLIGEVSKKLQAAGFSPGDVNDLVYPNALQFVADLAVKHDPSLRQTTKGEFLQHLKKIRKTAVSRWTLALKTSNEVMKARRKQLQQNLKQNARQRYFLIDASQLDDFGESFIVFVADYLAKYHHKVAHIETPLFCLDCDETVFNETRDRLHLKGIRGNDGLVGSKFYSAKFNEAPIIETTRSRIVGRSFDIRLVRLSDEMSWLSCPKCQDFFLLSEKSYSKIDFQDVNVERLGAKNLRQAKYLLGITDAIE